jgi:hypothetical protein
VVSGLVGSPRRFLLVGGVNRLIPGQALLISRHGVGIVVERTLLSSAGLGDGCWLMNERFSLLGMRWRRGGRIKKMLGGGERRKVVHS